MCMYILYHFIVIVYTFRDCLECGLVNTSVEAICCIFDHICETHEDLKVVAEEVKSRQSVIVLRRVELLYRTLRYALFVGYAVFSTATN